MSLRQDFALFKEPALRIVLALLVGFIGGGGALLKWMGA